MDRPSQSQPSLLSPKAAALRAGVSPSLVYRWCTDGTLSHFRVGSRGRRGKILIDPVDLDALLATFRVEGRVASMAPAGHAAIPSPRVTPTTSFSELDPKRLERAWKKT